MKKKYLIKGMTCAACVSHVERVVKKLDDAREVNVSLLNNTLTLETDTLSDETIMNAVKKAGFKISIYDVQYNKESKNRKIKLIISSLFLILLLYVAMGSMIGCPLPSFLVGAENSLYFILAQVLLLIPIYQSERY